MAANYSSNYGAVTPVVQVYQEEKPDYHAQFFWKQDIQVSDVALDALLLDYEWVSKNNSTLPQESVIPNKYLWYLVDTEKESQLCEISPPEDFFFVWF